MVDAIDCIHSKTGEVFEATHEDKTVFSFDLGKGAEIQSQDVALKTMKVNQSLLTLFFLNNNNNKYPNIIKP